MKKHLSQNHKTLVTIPILSNELFVRGRGDLINVKINPDGEHNWILNYQNHFTEWIIGKYFVIIKLLLNGIKYELDSIRTFI